MIRLGTVSVDDLDEALKCLLLEASRRDMETAKSCYWKMADGGLVTLGSMSDSHLENTITMLQRLKKQNDIVMEGGAE